MSLTWHDHATDASRSMSQTDLDAQLSPSRLVESLDDELALYASRSAQARAAAAGYDGLHEGLSYGAHADEKIDLLLPDSDGLVPLMIYVHGGFWQQLSRRESVFAAQGIVARGGAFAAVGYTLAPHASLDDIVLQVRQAVAWLVQNATTFGLDRARIVVSGSSAGAHLAALLLLTDWREFALPQPVIAGACLVSGVYDLAAVRESYVNEPLMLDQAQVARLSPLRQISAGEAYCGCPLALVYGDNETAEFKRESQCLARQLTASGSPVNALQIAGRHHFDVIADLDNAATYLGNTAMHLLGLAR